MISPEGLGWVGLICGILAEANYLAKHRLKKTKKKTKSMDFFMGNSHKVWGILMLVFGLLHGILISLEQTGSLYLLVTPNLGSITFLAILLVTGIYYCRKRLPKWFALHRYLAVVIAVLLVFHVMAVHG